MCNASSKGQVPECTDLLKICQWLVCYMCITKPQNVVNRAMSSKTETAWAWTQLEQKPQWAIDVKFLNAVSECSWSDWANAHANLILCWAQWHGSFWWFHHELALLFINDNKLYFSFSMQFYCIQPNKMLAHRLLYGFTTLQLHLMSFDYTVCHVVH